MNAITRTGFGIIMVLALPQSNHFGPAALSAAGASCESLTSLKLANGRVTAAAVVRAGHFVAPPSATPPTPEAAANAARAYAALPDFCRVSATLTPTSDSDIKIEVWL